MKGHTFVFLLYVHTGQYTARRKPKETMTTTTPGLQRGEWPHTIDAPFCDEPSTPSSHKSRFLVITVHALASIQD
jgi:hypothetical protein